MGSWKLQRTIVLLLMLAFLAACSTKPGQEVSTNPENSSGATATTAETPSQGAQPNLTPRPGTASSATPAVPETVVIPGGTAIPVRLDSALGSKTSNAGDNFTATVSQPVEVNGKVAIPLHSQASGTVVDAKPLGRFKGGAVLSIRLNSIDVGGKTYQIRTASVTRTAKGKGKRTAVTIGGGAGLGALIGGLAGGGKGAAIGAGVGAGAGTAGAAYTGNKDIVLPAETPVSFKLSDPLELK